MKAEVEWVDIFSGLPKYGKPVLLYAKGVVQHVIYMLDGADGCVDWFEPYSLEHDDNFKLKWSDASHWAELPEPPKNQPVIEGVGK